MTEYQLQYLRFLRMREEFPELNHRGHEPGLNWDALLNGCESLPRPHRDIFDTRYQRFLAEREFYRLER